MSITIKLDAPALRALIADDADFKLELQRAVIAEVVKNSTIPSIVNEFSKVTAGLVGEVVAQIREDAGFQKAVANELSRTVQYTTSGYKLTPDMKARLDGAVLDHVNQIAKDQLPSLVKAQQGVIEVLKAYLDEHTPGRIKDAIDAYDKGKIRTEVERRLNAIREAI